MKRNNLSFTTNSPALKRHCSQTAWMSNNEQTSQGNAASNFSKG